MPADEAAAYRLLERLRWGGPPPACPHCGVPGRCFFLEPVGAEERSTRTGAPTQRRVWKCGACRRQFSVLVGTVLQGTRLSLWTWIGVARAGGPVSAADVASRYGISRAAARHLLRRLAAAGCAGAGDEALTAVLRVPGGQADRLRWATPARRRPRPQRGPSADYG